MTAEVKRLILGIPLWTMNVVHENEKSITTTPQKMVDDREKQTFVYDWRIEPRDVCDLEACLTDGQSIDVLIWRGLLGIRITRFRDD